MSQRTKLYIFGGLVVILAVTLLANLGGEPDILPGAVSSDKFVPINVQDPVLRLELLEHIRKQEYAGAKVNLFTGRPLPKPGPSPEDIKKAQESNPGPPAEQPLVVPYKFYGVVTDPKTNRKRAFFTNGEEVLIVAEGETFKGAWRLLHIGNASADVEEVASGKRATLPLEQPVGPGA